MSREELRKLDGIHLVQYATSAQWSSEILALVTSHYRNKDAVKQDLFRFAAEAGQQAPTLNVYGMKNATVACANGQRLSGRQYLRIAALSFGWDEAGEDVPYHVLERTLKELKRIAYGSISFPPEYDAAYFDRSLRADLEAFASLAGTTVELMAAGNIDMLKCRCANGEDVLGVTYMMRAAVALGFADNTREISLMSILRQLKEHVGIRVKEPMKMDEWYFRNRERVIRDIESFAAAVSVSVSELNIAQLQIHQAACSNGETILGTTYLTRAVHALGLEQGEGDTTYAMRKKALHVLLEMYAAPAGTEAASDSLAPGELEDMIAEECAKMEPAYKTFRRDVV